MLKRVNIKTRGVRGPPTTVVRRKTKQAVARDMATGHGGLRNHFFTKPYLPKPGLLKGMSSNFSLYISRQWKNLITV